MLPYNTSPARTAQLFPCGMQWNAKVRKKAPFVLIGCLIIVSLLNTLVDLPQNAFRYVLIVVGTISLSGMMLSFAHADSVKKAYGKLLSYTALPTPATSMFGQLKKAA